MDREPVKLRVARSEDVAAMTRIHLMAFPGFFLSFLGPRFLRVLYAATIADRTGVALVAHDDHRILGFATGTTEPSGFYRRLLVRRWWSFGWAAVGPALKRPRVIPRLLRAFRKPGEKSNAAEDPTALLMSIAVAPDAQGRGVGRALIQAFRIACRDRGAKHLNLTTDRVANDATNQFYQQLGFTLARQFNTAENRAMNEYVCDLTKLPEPAP